MRTVKIAAVTAAVFFIAAGAHGQSGAERQVSVYLDNSVVVPIFVRARAESLASKIFAGIGVTLNFQSTAPTVSNTQVIVIEFVDSTPARLLPGAWADARTYEGVHIRIFWDRLQLRCSEQLMAHVMVHEITHILQGVSRHSAEGIMNFRWTDRERLALERRPLDFTRADVDLIYQGMEARAAGRAGQVLAAVPTRVDSLPAVP